MFYTNISLKRCVDIAHQYQETRDSALFELFLARFDSYLLYYILHFKKKCDWLRQVESEDLYQTAIVALHRSILTVTKNETPEYLPLRIKAYLIREIQKQFNYKMHEFSYDGDLTEIIDQRYNAINDFNFEQEDFRTMCKIVKFTRFQRDVLHRLLIRRQTYKEVAKAHHTTPSNVCSTYRCSIKKIKTAVESGRYYL